MNEETDDQVKVLNLRLNEAMHRQLAAEAKRSVRSLQGEIIWRLRKSLDGDARSAPKPAA